MMDRASCTLYYSFGLSSLSLPFELSVLLSSVAYADHSTSPLIYLGEAPPALCI